jgi:hypothetical protein
MERRTPKDRMSNYVCEYLGRALLSVSRTTARLGKKFAPPPSTDAVPAGPPPARIPAAPPARIPDERSHVPSIREFRVRWAHTLGHSEYHEYLDSPFDPRD